MLFFQFFNSPVALKNKKNLALQEKVEITPLHVTSLYVWIWCLAIYDSNILTTHDSSDVAYVIHEHQLWILVRVRVYIHHDKHNWFLVRKHCLKALKKMRQITIVLKGLFNIVVVVVEITGDIDPQWHNIDYCI